MTGICEKCGASFIEQHCPGCPNDPKNKKEPPSKIKIPQNREILISS